MDLRSCSVLGCIGTYYAKTFCARHYQQHRLHGTVPTLNVTERSCAHCALPLARKTDDRSIYCSRDCKDAAYLLRAQRARKQMNASRTCKLCGKLFGLTRSGKALFCSDECSTKFYNNRRAAKQHADRIVDRGPCKGCGQSIPETCRSNAVYCNRECKERHDHESPRARGSSLAYNRMHYYGLKPGEFEAILESQDGKCGICRLDTWPGRYNKPHVDHCHDTKRVRGILCHSCNVALGNFHDSIDLLEAALAYLKR